MWRCFHGWWRKLFRQHFQCVIVTSCFNWSNIELMALSMVLPKNHLQSIIFSVFIFPFFIIRLWINVPMPLIGIYRLHSLHIDALNYFFIFFFFYFIFNTKYHSLKILPIFRFVLYFVPSISLLLVISCQSKFFIWFYSVVLCPPLMYLLTYIHISILENIDMADKNETRVEP